MTREEAERVLTKAGEALDAEFPLLEAAIACAVHDIPFRDPQPVRALAEAAAARLAERLHSESPDEALAEPLSGDMRLSGALLTYDAPANTDVVDVAERRRGISATRGVFYLHAARKCGLKADGVDFPNHFLLRVDTEDGPVTLDPFSQRRQEQPTKQTRQTLSAGLTPDVADRLE